MILLADFVHLIYNPGQQSASPGSMQNQIDQKMNLHYQKICKILLNEGIFNACGKDLAEAMACLGAFKNVLNTPQVIKKLKHSHSA